MNKQVVYNIFTLIIILVLIILLTNKCNEGELYKEQIENIINYENDSIIYYRDKADNLIAQRNVLVGEKETLEYYLTQSNNDNEQLKRQLDKKAKVEYINTIEQETIIDSIYIPIENKTFEVKNPHFEIKGGILNDDIYINSLYIPNKITLTTTTRKGITSIKVNNSNPYIHTTSIDSYLYKANKERLNKRIGIGVQVGYNLKLEPYIGIGISYNLFSF